MKRLLLLLMIIIPTVNCVGYNIYYSKNPKVKKYNEQALNQSAVRNYDGALVLIDRAISLDSKDVCSYYNKVSILWGMKDYKNALITAKKGLLVDPEFVELSVTAGALCEIMADSASAFDYYRKAIKGYEKRIAKPGYSRELSESQFFRACLLRYCGREAEGNRALEKLKEEGFKDNDFIGLLKVDRQEYLKSLGIKKPGKNNVKK